ncbi:tetratricopeptide repeat protein [Massilia sp. S19_KUP03_FR1]|uniref:tetratricopeptide repeat protein n=1 Tax=Massilia sp. S19_KUP03_FR1 TaxID=3025503 RepID=UPI002FCDD120
MRTLLLTGLLFLFAQVHGPAASRDLRPALMQAERALATHNYAQAYRAYKRHATTNPLAQFNLGLFEQQGWGRPADPVAACAWFDQAAHGHIPAAQQFLGDCLARGVGRAIDGAAAVAWYRKAAAAGIAYADCAAGELYLDGAIVPRDVAQGLALCTRAAQAESVPAMLKLGAYYQAAATLPHARFWYDQAAQRHHHGAQVALGMMLSAGEGGPADLAQARFWLEHAAMEGYAPAYLPTAILYANAPINPDTGALEPHDLAKVYMWSHAARARTSNQQELADIARIDALVMTVMPEQWQPELDRRVTDHLARYAAP